MFQKLANQTHPKVGSVVAGNSYIPLFGTLAYLISIDWIVLYRRE